MDKFIQLIAEHLAKNWLASQGILSQVANKKGEAVSEKQRQHARIDREQDEKKTELDQLRIDALRWRRYATSPQTALMLGSKLDPNEKGVDWVAECNRLVDTLPSLGD